MPIILLDPKLTTLLKRPPMCTLEFANASLVWPADTRHIFRFTLRSQYSLYDHYEMGTHEL